MFSLSSSLFNQLSSLLLSDIVPKYDRTYVIMVNTKIVEPTAKPEIIDVLISQYGITNMIETHLQIKN